MTITEAFAEIAERAVDAASSGETANLSEVTGFYSYHWVESTGGAWCPHVGLSADAYRRLRHEDKLTAFVKSARGHRFEKQARELAIVVSSLRNRFLYPVNDGAGSFSTPQYELNMSGAKCLLARARALFKSVKYQL